MVVAGGGGGEGGGAGSPGQGREAGLEHGKANRTFKVDFQLQSKM